MIYSPIWIIFFPATFIYVSIDICIYVCIHVYEYMYIYINTQIVIKQEVFFTFFCINMRVYLPVPPYEQGVAQGYF